MRIILLPVLISLLITTSFSREATVQEKKEFLSAKKYYKKGLYDTSLSILKGRYNLKSISAPSGALDLAARNYEKLGFNKDALVIYALLIKKKYSKINSKVTSSYRKNGNADNIPEIDEKLSYYYYKKAYNTKVLYDQSNTQLYFKAAKMFSEICMEGEFYEDEAEELFEEVSSRSSEYRKLLFSRSKVLSISYLTWQDDLKLISPAGQEQEIHSTAEGTCFGGGVNYSNAYVNYKMEGCFAMATSTVGEDSKDVKYFQTDVSQRAIFLYPGVLWKPQAGDVSIGFSTPLVYRVGDYTQPDGFEIESTSKLSFGLMLESKYQYKKIGLDLKLGKLIGFSSSVLSFGLNYFF